MQLVLCAALAVTLALAWWIGHAHAIALTVGLGPPQTFKNPAMDLVIRAPDGWRQYAKPDSADIVFAETKRHYGARRAVRVDLKLLGKGALPTPEQVIANDVGNGTTTFAQKFTFLGHEGALAEFPELNDPTTGRIVRSSILYACTILPGSKPTAVRVIMTGPFSFAPADIELLENIAQALQPVDPAHPYPEITPTADNDAPN
jgi:hypothetical protein